MQIVLKKSAEKDLDKLRGKVFESVAKKIKELENFPNVSNVKKLTKFDPKYRLRVGSYRVLFDVAKEKIIICRIKHRKNAYLNARLG